MSLRTRRVARGRSRRFGIASIVAVSLATACVTRAAGLADEPDLPRASIVASALRNQPAVAAARAGVRAQAAVGDALRTGPYEFNVRVDGEQRRDRPVDARYREWGAYVERAVRLPGKARLDGEIGAVSVAQANLLVGDALHESGRTLLRMWFSWMRAAAQTETWTRQRESLADQRDIVARRVRLGDAPRQEVLQADAAVAQADVAKLQAHARAAAAEAEFRRTFPELALPERPSVRAPRALDGAFESWRDAYLEHNHELGAAHAEASRRTLIGERVRAERLPDPTLGVHVANERSYAERVVGVYLSVPLSGDLRAARAAEASAQAEVATQREAAIRRRLEADIASLHASAVAAYDSALKAVEAARQMTQSAALTSRAYALGEVSLSDVLLARRLAIEADLASTLAQLDAAEQRYRLLLDTHRLWPLDGDE